MTQTLHLLFISGFCFTFTLGSSDFHLIELVKSYKEAKTYCREMYTDLATVHNSTDMKNLITLATTTDRAWIGLEIGDVWMWHWSWPDQKLDFLNWKAGQPQKNNQDACAAMDQHGEWFESDCGTKRSFVCQGISEPSGPIFVAETKSWRDAQNHCRNLLSDLVSIHSAEENEAVQNVSGAQNVWTGLFKDPWQWSDGSNSSFRNWKPSQPNYFEGQDCAAVIFKDQGKWNDLKCVTKRNFVCQGARKSVPTTTTQRTTQDTLTTVTTDDDSVSGLTTPVGTSAHPTENSQSTPPGKLILIQKNMTWIEAMSYCRKHHIDLVHILTKDIQEKVAEKAKNSTSPHVWLGLRYTCNFNFWFWTSSTTGCYLNWAPGQGPEGKYDCGVTGAIEATGRQQWVGLPQTEKLNFICYTCVG